jgi:hypothetical protein
MDFTSAIQSITSSYFSNSKIVILLSRRLSYDEKMNDLALRVISSLVLISCFTLTLIPTASLLFSIIAAYSILMFVEISMRTLASKLTSMHFQVSLITISSLCALSQSFVIVIATMNMESPIFIKWVSASTIVLALTAVAQDFIVMPAIKLIMDKLAKKTTDNN